MDMWQVCKESQLEYCNLNFHLLISYVFLSVILYNNVQYKDDERHAVCESYAESKKAGDARLSNITAESSAASLLGSALFPCLLWGCCEGFWRQCTAPVVRSQAISVMSGAGWLNQTLGFLLCQGKDQAKANICSWLEVSAPAIHSKSSKPRGKISLGLFLPGPLRAVLYAP